MWQPSDVTSWGGGPSWIGGLAGVGVSGKLPGIEMTLSVANTNARTDVHSTPLQPFGRNAADNDLMSAMPEPMVQSGLPFALAAIGATAGKPMSTCTP